MLPQPRLGFAWNVLEWEDRGAWRFWVAYDRYRSDVNGMLLPTHRTFLTRRSISVTCRNPSGGGGALSPSAITVWTRVRTGR